MKQFSSCNLGCCCRVDSEVVSVVSDSALSYRQQPTSLLRPWDSAGKNTGVGYHFLLQCMKVKSECEVAQSCRLFVTSWTAAYQAPASMGVSRQEYWSLGWLFLLSYEAIRFFLQSKETLGLVTDIINTATYFYEYFVGDSERQKKLGIM